MAAMTTEDKSFMKEIYAPFMKLYQLCYRKEPKYALQYLSPNSQTLTSTVVELLQAGVLSGDNLPKSAFQISLMLKGKDYANCIGNVLNVIGDSSCFMAFEYNEALTSEMTVPCFLTANKRFGNATDTPLYRVTNIFPSPKHMNKEDLIELQNSIFITFLLRHIESIKTPQGCSITLNCPAVQGDKKVNCYGADIPVINDKQYDDFLSMIYMIRRQNYDDTQILSTWEDDLDLEVISLVPADAYRLPSAWVELIAETFRFFECQYRLSFHKQPMPEDYHEKSEDEARFYLYSKIIRKNVETLFFLKDKQPIGVLEYDARIYGPVHLCKLFVYKDFRGKGYGSWMLKQFLRETYAMTRSMPYQTLSVFGSEEKELYPFYHKFGFHLSSMDVTIDIPVEAITYLQQQLNA